ELLADGTQDYDPHPPLFDAALGVLRTLGARPGRPPGNAVAAAAGTAALPGSPASLDAVTAFELVWLKELGYSPRLDTCAACGSDVLPPGLPRATFSPSAGGVLCLACGPAAPDHRPLSAEGLGALRVLSSAAGSDTPVSPGLPASVRVEVRGVLGQVVSSVLGRRPRMLGYVESRE